MNLRSMDDKYCLHCFRPWGKETTEFKYGDMNLPSRGKDTYVAEKSRQEVLQSCEVCGSVTWRVTVSFVVKNMKWEKFYDSEVNTTVIENDKWYLYQKNKNIIKYADNYGNINKWEHITPSIKERLK